jgi:hypothetical protein
MEPALDSRTEKHENSSKATIRSAVGLIAGDVSKPFRLIEERLT